MVRPTPTARAVGHSSRPPPPPALLCRLRRHAPCSPGPLDVLMAGWWTWAPRHACGGDGRRDARAEKCDAPLFLEVWRGQARIGYGGRWGLAVWRSWRLLSLGRGDGPRSLRPSQRVPRFFSFDPHAQNHNTFAFVCYVAPCFSSAHRHAPLQRRLDAGLGASFDRARAVECVGALAPRAGGHCGPSPPPPTRAPPARAWCRGLQDDVWAVTCPVHASDRLAGACAGRGHTSAQIGRRFGQGALGVRARAAFPGDRLVGEPVRGQCAKGDACAAGRGRHVWRTKKKNDHPRRPPAPSPLSQVLRVSAFSVGLIYGSWRLSSLRSRAAKAAAANKEAGHH